MRRGRYYEVRGVCLALAVCVLGLLTWLAGGVVGTVPALAAVCANENVRVMQIHGTTLPDCRAYEQVSPVEKEGIDAHGFPGDVGASPDGERVRYYSIKTPFPGICVPEGGDPWYVSSRVGAGAWSTAGVLPCESPLASVRGFSEDLKEAVVWSETPLSEDAPAGVRYYYAYSTVTGAYQLLAPVNGPESEEYRYFALAGFSDDDSHLIVESEEPLAAGARAGAPNLYEADLEKAQPLSLVGVVPRAGEPSCSGLACEVPAEGTVAGAGAYPFSKSGQHFTQNAISQNGSRVFFTAEPSERVYVREGEQRTVTVSEGAAHFWAATPEGQYVFYWEDEDLYRYDVQAGDRVTVAGGAAGLLGVLGVSGDGGTVYFAATGVLAANENEHHETAASAREVANLYEWHQPVTGPASITFVSTLTNTGEGGDEPDWSNHVGTVFGSDLMKTSRVTLDGTTLLFSSRRALTGYNNNGIQEFFRYRAGHEGTPGSLVCVSCDPSGAPAVGNAYLAGEGGGIGPAQEVALSRNLSEDGDRVFFETPNPLVAADGDTGGHPSCETSVEKTTGCDVYEWEADGEGSCASEAQDGGCLYLISSGTSTEESYLLDASANGNDVFFFTRQALVPTDLDSNVDVYDARVDGGLVKTPPECSSGTLFNPTTERCEQPECESAAACKPPPTGAPAELFPATSAFSGSGNLMPSPEQKLLPAKLTNAQRLAAALKTCRKDKRKKKRVICEKHVRHKYAPAKTDRKE